MKKTSIFLGMYATLAITNMACTSVKGFEQPFKNQMPLGKEGEKVFIIKKTGERVEGTIIEFSKSSVWKVKDTENWVSIDQIKINKDEIDRIQTRTSYQARFVPDPKRSPYGFFVDRLRFGKLSLYYYEHEGLAQGTDVRGSYHTYVFEKGESGLLGLNYAIFSSAIQDNGDALQLFRKLYPKQKIPKFNEKGNLHNLIQVVELYNK